MQPNPTITVFRHPGHRYVGTNPLVLAAVIGFVTIAVGVWLSSENIKTFYLTPIMAWVGFRFGLPHTEKIYFFVQRNLQNELAYGWMDSNKRRQGDVPIQEWSHWYVEGLSIGKTKNYILYVSFTNGADTVYLKEEFKSATPPVGWSQSEEIQENKTGVFQVGGLKTLVMELDKISEIESVN